jgi:tetratricopeptide (TPR) repeat protein
MPARYVLERQRWDEAAALQVPALASLAKFPFAEGHIVYARAVGSAKRGDAATAEAAAERLQALAASVRDARFQYFADQMNLQRQAALGLVAMSRGREDDAIAILRRAAASEDSLGKHPVSPGAILPIRELLAAVLLEAGRPEEALVEFEASLAIYPSRFNGVAGAAMAAEKAGRAGTARKYYDQLLALARSGDGTRPAMATATRYRKRS